MNNVLSLIIAGDWDIVEISLLTQNVIQLNAIPKVGDDRAPLVPDRCGFILNEWVTGLVSGGWGQVRQVG